MPRKRLTDAEHTAQVLERAAAKNHRAFLTTDINGPLIRVVSETMPDVRFFVRAEADATTGRVKFECRADDPEFLHASSDRPLPCTHAAVAAKRLVREGFARFGDDGVVYANLERVSA